jgi:hypothetical protein
VARIVPFDAETPLEVRMPGEHRTIRTKIDLADARGEEPRIVGEGFNVSPAAAG